MSDERALHETIAELRSRLAAAEAERDQAKRNEAYFIDLVHDGPEHLSAIAEAARLRAGIQALADDAEKRGIESGPPLTLRSLRSLLPSPKEGDSNAEQD